MTHDLTLKPKQIEKIESFNGARSKLLECLRSLELELEINTLFQRYENQKLEEGYKKSQTK